jgi:Skp family chaperone for outer membrane proteins
MFYLVLFFILTAIPAPGLAIMLSSSRIAYVNIEKVFDSVVTVKHARKNLQDMIDTSRNDISQLREAIDSVRKRISEPTDKTARISETVTPPDLSSSTFETPYVQGSTEIVKSGQIRYTTQTVSDIGPAPEIPDFELEEMNRLLRQKEGELAKLKQDSLDAITSKEQNLKKVVMADIYDAIKEISLDMGITVVMDKEAVFFAGGSVEDITDIVIRRINEEAKRHKY